MKYKTITRQNHLVRFLHLSVKLHFHTLVSTWWVWSFWKQQCLTSTLSLHVIPRHSPWTPGHSQLPRHSALTKPQSGSRKIRWRRIWFHVDTAELFTVWLRRNPGGLLNRKVTYGSDCFTTSMHTTFLPLTNQCVERYRSSLNHQEYHGRLLQAWSGSNTAAYWQPGRYMHE